VSADPLLDERAVVLRDIESLRREFDQVVEASASSNADDEHDPEGATIAFERSQVATLARQHQAHLAEIDAAVARLEAGTYGRCETCGEQIADARLEAMPAARSCMACASQRR